MTWKWCPRCINFPEKSRTEIDKLKPSISDWMIIIQEAMALVTGEANSQGEH